MPNSNPTPPNRILAWLLKRGDDHRKNLQLLITGAGLFFSGAGIIIWANNAMASSVEQELIALFGLLFCIAGCLTALLGYLGLSLFRLIRFFNDE